MFFFKGYSVETVFGGDTVVSTNAVPGAINDIRVKIMNQNGLALAYSLHSDPSEAAFYDSPPPVSLSQGTMKSSYGASSPLQPRAKS